MPGAGAVVQAGTLDQRIRIIAPPTELDSFGDTQKNDYSKWSVFISGLWAARTPTGGTEMRRSDREVSESLTTFTIRYHQPLPDETMVIVHRGDNYEIKGVSDIDTARQAVDITCKLVK